MQLAHGRKIILIDNHHQYQRWFINYEIENSNAKIMTTYGIHPKYLPTNPQSVLEQMENIFKHKFNLNTKKVAIGECGLDDTSRYSFDFQLSMFEFQVKLAAELQIPIVLHGRRENSFSTMLNALKQYLKPNHNIHWHCVNPKSDLNVINNFLYYFVNSFIGLNGSIILQDDEELQKLFNKWLFGQPNIIDHIIIKTDFPFLCPPGLEQNQYSFISGITITAQYIVNILRMKNMNTTEIIDKSNKNIQRMYLID
ncbi:unnamed protein product [Rotaria sordida]|uniref:Uncharacterized protein n=1 Tax=Rotaria sordida TaxID=392033 RepID=A0A815TG95_9BILA|nr:unnamed protein product [Rotaria sordida]CAF1656508.1 unnamed protein product [Rotaria sordida]